MKIEANIVNAFTANGSGGNPAGVVLDASDLTDAQMLKIARQLGLAETAFVTQQSKTEATIRFFAPTQEVNLCGHASIACWAFMHKQDLYGSGSYKQITPAGELGIEIKPDGQVFMEQVTAELLDKVSREQVAATLSAKLIDFNTKLEPQVVSTGLKMLLIPVKNRKILQELRSDNETIKKLCKQLNILGFHVFCTTEDNESIADTRNIAPLLGVAEESATGTANGALLCYLRHNKVLPDRAIYRIEQGNSMGQLSYLYGRFQNDKVWIGGYTKIVSEEELII